MNKYWYIPINQTPYSSQIALVFFFYLMSFFCSGIFQDTTLYLVILSS